MTKFFACIFINMEKIKLKILLGFIDKWMGKEAMVHVRNGILLSHKKEHIQVSSNEVDEPRAYYTEWSKSEIEI